MAQHGKRIQVDTNTWVVLRELTTQPKGIIERITDTREEARYILRTWHPDPAQRRMFGIYKTLDEADSAVPWPGPPDHGPGPGASQAEKQAWMEKSGRDGSGIPKPDFDPYKWKS